MVKKKAKSKRQPLKIKYKIERKVKEHHRKLRKEAKKNPHLKTKLKKDPGIPNLWPFKEQLIKEADEQRKIEEKEKFEQKQRQRRASLAEQKLKEDQNKDSIGSEMKTLETDVVTKREYMKELRKVVEDSDVILEVLDARDPLGCRCPDVETMVLSRMGPDGYPTKRLVLILNKIDLIPPEMVVKWVKYLRGSFPCLAFKSSTQQKGHLKQIAIKGVDATQDMLAMSASVGGPALLQLLKNYCRTVGSSKKTITVGVIGYPNVGKSSIINSLKRTRAVGVSSVPGFTRTLSHVKLDNNLDLIDSPGVIFSAGLDDKNLILRNCLKVEQIEDPIGAVYAVVEKCKKEALMEIYEVASFSDPEQFIGMVAQKRGKLKKGGIPDLKITSRIILQDWNDGKIPFYSIPPEAADTTRVEFVDKWSAEFDMDRVGHNNNFEELRMELAAAAAPSSTSSGGGGSAIASRSFMVKESSKPFTNVLRGESSNDDTQDNEPTDMDDDSTPVSSSSSSKTSLPSRGTSIVGGGQSGGAAGARSRRNSLAAATTKDIKVTQEQKSSNTMNDDINPQQNKNIRKQQKKSKKDRRKSISSTVGDDEASAMDAES